MTEKTERIDHAAAAKCRCDQAEAIGTSPENMALALGLLAQAEATLALVEQQRIQNLIALEALQKPAFHSSYLMHNAQTNIDANNAMYRLRPTIAAALGIGEAS